MTMQIVNLTLDYIAALITKTQKLAKAGVGPDLFKSATLTKQAAENLMTIVKENCADLKSNTLNYQKTSKLLDTLYFYLKAEKLRVKASYLVAPVKFMKYKTRVLRTKKIKLKN